MYNSRISGLGYYVPDNVVTNEDLSKLMDTNDEWIQERTGIKERRHVSSLDDTTTSSMKNFDLEIIKYIESQGYPRSEIREALKQPNS